MIKLEEYLDILKKDYDGWDDSYKFVIDNLKSKTPFAYGRFNDGEMMGIIQQGSVVARGDQIIDQSLHLALRDAITHKQKNYYIGIPCEKCYPKYNRVANNLIGDYDFKVSAVALTNRNWARFISEISEVMPGKNVRYVSGHDQDLSFIRKHLNFNVMDHIKLNSKNSWASVSKILGYISEIKDGDIVFISLGPTARVLVKEWFKIKPNATFIDIGSVLDPFTRDVWHNCHKGWGYGFNLTNRCETCN